MDGIRPNAKVCSKPCRKTLSKNLDSAWRKENPERWAELQRRDYEKNRETRLAINKRWRESNPILLAENHRRYRNKNKELLRVKNKEFIRT